MDINVLASIYLLKSQHRVPPTSISMRPSGQPTKKQHVAQGTSHTTSKVHLMLETPSWFHSHICPQCR